MNQFSSDLTTVKRKPGCRCGGYHWGYSASMSSRSPYSSPNSKSPRADMSHRLARLSEPAFAPSTSTSQQSTDSAILSVAYSPDGDSIATGSKDGVVVSWNLDFENCTSTMREHTASVYHVCWCREGGLIASASADNNVALWDPSKVGSSAVLRGHQGAVRCCSFSSDDSLLASSSGDTGDTHSRPFRIHSQPFSLSVTVLWLCPCLAVPHSLAVPLCLTHSLAVPHSLLPQSTRPYECGTCGIRLHRCACTLCEATAPQSEAAHSIRCLLTLPLSPTMGMCGCGHQRLASAWPHCPTVTTDVEPAASILHCIACTLQCTASILHCIACTLHCTLHCIACTLHCTVCLCTSCNS